MGSVPDTDVVCSTPKRVLVAPSFTVVGSDAVIKHHTFSMVTCLVLFGGILVLEARVTNVSTYRTDCTDGFALATRSYLTCNV